MEKAKPRTETPSRRGPPKYLFFKKPIKSYKKFSNIQNKMKLTKLSFYLNDNFQKNKDYNEEIK